MHISLKVLVTTTDALGHFETGLSRSSVILTPSKYSPTNSTCFIDVPCGCAYNNFHDFSFTTSHNHLSLLISFFIQELNMLSTVHTISSTPTYASK